MSHIWANYRCQGDMKHAIESRPKPYSFFLVVALHCHGQTCCARRESSNILRLEPYCHPNVFAVITTAIHLLHHFLLLTCPCLHGPVAGGAAVTQHPNHGHVRTDVVDCCGASAALYTIAADYIPYAVGVANLGKDL